MDEDLTKEYLNRIGATRPAQPDLDGLRHLQERQIMTVPFENIDYHLDRQIFMTEEVLTKIVRERRGGGCYETNPALGYLLESLGYSVAIHPGRVYYRDGRLSPPLCHLVLRVDLEERWLVDTGFGRNSMHPLRFDSREPQADPNGEYRLADADGGIDLYLNERLLYRIDDRTAIIDDFRPTLQWYRTAPESPFMQDLFCSLPTETGRVTLKGQQLTIADGDGKSVEELTDDLAVLAAYRKYFGIELEQPPRAPGSADAGVQL
ncbi:arylamine N-acetyltransferase family protein [Jatrophihabitans sp.]|uniref:arylamine N-acetyltransferase family protein n=1 Tax=Jatrophihabitans sp. TaxID=1932789 RepID=UPI002B8C5F9F|nr:arylamine N-acetyltransferase [Jatrophihabitans sp.]